MDHSKTDDDRRPFMVWRAALLECPKIVYAASAEKAARVYAVTHIDLAHHAASFDRRATFPLVWAGAHGDGAGTIDVTVELSAAWTPQPS